MEKMFSKGNIRIMLVAWLACALVAAYFIPSYDFGFDGVKIWLVICGLLLVFILAGALAREFMQRRFQGSGPVR